MFAEHSYANWFSNFDTREFRRDVLFVSTFYRHFDTIYFKKFIFAPELNKISNIILQTLLNSNSYDIVFFFFSNSIKLLIIKMLEQHLFVSPIILPLKLIAIIITFRTMNHRSNFIKFSPSPMKFFSSPSSRLLAFESATRATFNSIAIASFSLTIDHRHSNSIPTIQSTGPFSLSLSLPQWNRRKRKGETDITQTRKWPLK